MSRFTSLLVGSALIVALSFVAFAQQSQQPVSNNPLVELLQAKGIISSEEAANINQASSAEEANTRLAQLLVNKGLISEQEYKTTFVSTPAGSSATGQLLNAVYHPEPTAASGSAATSNASLPAQGSKPSEPQVIPAVAPLRVLPIDIPKQAGMIPDIKLGGGANMKIYGFYKASAVSDTASSGGPTFGSQDWPLPLLIGGDTGPTSDPQVHIKARQFRIGMQTEWVPKDSGFTITGRVEGDFEGDYTDVNNRNISSDARSQFSLRLAWVRLDHKIGGLPWFASFGEDWSLLSSTLPNLFETTGLGVGMGSLYERLPIFRTGLQFRAGEFKIQPEFAIANPVAGSSALTTDQRLRFGDRAGSESNQPALEARVVFQFPLNRNWKGVAPAQLIFSGHHARMNEIIPHTKQVINETETTCTALPCPITVFNSTTVPNVGLDNLQSWVGASNCPEASGICTLYQLFPKGLQVGNPQNIWTTELQLPTPWVTFVAKFYRGNDMRFFFAGQLNDVYSNLGALADPFDANGISESGRAITFGCVGAAKDALLANTTDCPNHNPVQVAKLQTVGGSGGFAELSFPLSRIFNANPEGHNAGWILHLEYSTDRANYADAQHGNHLGRTDLDTASLTYRLNRWVTFVHELSYIATFTANDHEAGGVIKPHKLLFAGTDVRQAHDWRNEFGPVFTF
jgi:hypothetical protein